MTDAARGGGDPRSWRRQRLSVLAVGPPDGSLLAAVESTPLARFEQMPVSRLLERLGEIAAAPAGEIDSVLVVVRRSEDIGRLDARPVGRHRAGPLITTLFIQDRPAQDGDADRALADGLILLRSMSDQLVITPDADYPAQVVAALTH